MTKNDINFKKIIINHTPKRGGMINFGFDCKDVMMMHLNHDVRIQPLLPK